MKPDDELLGPRWTDRSPGDPDGARAAQRLREVPAPGPLSPVQVERVAHRLSRARLPRRRRSLWIALFAATAFAGALGGWLRLRAPAHGASPSAPAPAALPVAPPPPQAVVPSRAPPPPQAL